MKTAKADNNSGQHAVFFHNRLKKQFKALAPRASAMKIDCYRLYNRDIPEVPLTVDIYGEYVRLNDFRHEQDDVQWAEEMARIVSQVTGIPEEKTFIKSRYSRARGQYGSGDKGVTTLVHEQGLKFEVNLSDYADTGLFTDHRITRDMVRSRAEGKHLLNLFSYTGAFTVYAADGGAERTAFVSV